MACPSKIRKLWGRPTPGSIGFAPNPVRPSSPSAWPSYVDVGGERFGKQRLQFAHAFFGIGPKERIAPKFLPRQFGQACEGDPKQHQNDPAPQAEHPDE